MNSLPPAACAVRPRLEVLDGLRGIAILLVVWFHYWQMSWLGARFNVFGFPLNLEFIGVAGYLGVELFFFISGFCLLYPYAKAKYEGGRGQGLGEYFHRRAAKILPSYIFAIAVILVFFDTNLVNWRDIAWHTFAHLTFIHNLFPETYGSINGVFWSLGVEIQFYFLFPLLIGLFLRRAWLGWLLLMGVALGYRLGVAHYQQDRMSFFMNQLPGVIDLFGSGMATSMLVVYLRSKGWLQGKKWEWSMAAAAVAFFALFLWLLYSAYLIRYEKNGIDLWLSTHRGPFGITLILLTVSSVFAASWWRGLLANRALTFLSVISYNLYMWHQYVGHLMRRYHFPPWVGVEPYPDKQWQLLFFFGGIPFAIAISWAMTRFIEKPFLKTGFTPLYLWFKDRVLNPFAARETR